MEFERVISDRKGIRLAVLVYLQFLITVEANSGYLSTQELRTVNGHFKGCLTRHIQVLK